MMTPGTFRHLLFALVIVSIPFPWGGGTALASAPSVTAGELTATTDFDSGGGAAVTVGPYQGTGERQADHHIRIELTDPMGYPHKGYLHFKLEGGEGQTVFLEVTNIDDSRMPSSHRLFHTTDLRDCLKSRKLPAESIWRGGILPPWAAGSRPSEGCPRLFRQSLRNLDWQRMEHEIGEGFFFTLPADEVNISNYHAYPYENIVRRVENLDRHPFVETEVIGQSHEGREMHVIRIAAPDIDREKALDYVILTRQHPGEVQGSWHMDGAIDYILEVLDDSARNFDNHYIFHLIPAANPDGIYHGIHRLDTQRHNLNREWDSESPVEIANIKNYLRANVRKMHWGLDLHSSTNLPFNYPAIWYDERAVDDEDREIIEELVEAVNSFNVSNSTVSDSRSRGFIYNEFDGLMVTTEVSTYWPDQTTDSLRDEGKAFIQATTATVPAE